IQRHIERARVRCLFFFSSRRRHTRLQGDWSSDVCSSDLVGALDQGAIALMFAVNPLGVQGDGTLIEGANVTASGFIGNAVVGREQPDLSPDFVFQSRGRVTDWGYEVEVRIPFKSIRYQPRQPQDWKLNIVREVQ